MIKDDRTQYEKLRAEALKDPEVLSEYESYKLQLERDDELKTARLHYKKSVKGRRTLIDRLRERLDLSNHID